MMEKEIHIAKLRDTIIHQQALIDELVKGLRYAFRYMPAEEQRQHIADLVTKAEKEAK